MIRVAAAVLLMLAVAGVTRSGAAFVAGLDEAPSAVAAGTLELEAGESGRAPVDASFMRPGGSRSGVVELRNAGTVDAVLEARVREVDGTAGLPAILRLRVEDCDTDPACEHPEVSYEDALTAADGAIDLGSVAAGASRHARVTVSWPVAEADPARQGGTAQATIVWTAVAGSAK